MNDQDQHKQIVDYWLREIVIGLGLCPFASKPARENTIEIVITHPETEEDLLNLLDDEMRRLSEVGADKIETILVVFPHFLTDFFDYNQFLQWANQSLKRNGWKGVFQFASFHPDYVFAGNHQDDAENFTNRAPFPMIHIIREESLEKALEYFPDVDEVPIRNQALMAEMSEQERNRLFYFLFKQ